MSELTLHTVPSTWIHATRPETTEPYQRVVGVEIELGLVACRFSLDGYPEPEPVTFDVPGKMARGVARFFGVHIADHDPEHPDNAEQFARLHDPSGKEPYTCHTFALSLQEGHSDLALQLRHRLTSAAIRGRQFRGNLPAGKHGLLIDPQGGCAAHSFVGLGEDVPFTLQVMEADGNMGLLSYDNLVREYSRSRHGRWMLIA